jgi:dienelactone hydrolase
MSTTPSSNSRRLLCHLTLVGIGIAAIGCSSGSDSGMPMAGAGAGLGFGTAGDGSTMMGGTAGTVDTAGTGAAGTTPLCTAGECVGTAGTSAGTGTAGDGAAGVSAGMGGAGDGAAGTGSVTGPDPTADSLSKDGPYTAAKYSDQPANSVYAKATIHYSMNGEPPYNLVALVPGWTESQPNVDWWGPRLASHGFVVIAIDTSTTNDCPVERGADLWAGLETLVAENTRSGSPLMGKLATTKKAVMGHSMGGGGSLIAATDHSDLKAAIPFTPWSGGIAPCTGTVGPTKFASITVPTLVIAGQGDAIAAEGTHAYPFYTSIPATTPKAYMEFASGGHNVANNGNTNQEMNTKYAVAWLKLYMDGDERYRTFIEGAEHDKDVTAGEFSQFEP